MKKIQHWEAWEENILRTKYKTNTVPQIQQRYLPHRTKDAIKYHLRILGLTTPRPTTKPTPWTENEDKTLEKYYHNKTIKEIQDTHLPNRTRSAIQNRAAALKLTTPRPGTDWVKTKRCARTTWTQAEVDILEAHAKTATINELTLLLPDKTATQIIKKRQILNLTKQEQRPWSQEELQILKDNASKCTLKQLNELLPNRRISTIQSKMTKLNLEYVYERSPNRRWTNSELTTIRENMSKPLAELAQLIPTRTERAIKTMRLELRKNQQQNPNQEQT